MKRYVQEFLKEHGKHVSSIALIGGFIFDYFTLTTIDRLYDNMVFLFYLVVVSVCIVLFGVLDVKGVKNRVYRYLPIVMQFAFGGLFSGFTVFYSRSTDFSVHLLFILILAGLLVGNELLKEKYERLVFQVSLLFVALISYTTFSIPIIVNRIGTGVFLASSIISSVAILLFVWMMYRLIPTRVIKAKKHLIISLGSIFVFVQIMYFLNVIPPIPLILKEAQVYSSIQKEGQIYIATRPRERWYEYVIPGQIVHSTAGAPLYLFSSVYSPADFSFPVVHHWQYFEGEKWVTTDKISFIATGGTDMGYRGYTRKNHLEEGVWRVDIETENGQIIGREVFTVSYNQGGVEIKEDIL
tara:strand:+ start:201 stop:1262 length:1062 start_codon:yes stop_codon:yes gene_type:complete